MQTDPSPWTVGAIAAVLTAGASWLYNAMRGGWKARDVVADLEKKIDDQASSIKKEIRDDLDELSRKTGEAVSAVRQKIAETDQKVFENELWGRDNFVRVLDFREVIAGINRNYESLASEMRGGFGRLSDKIDKLLTRE